MSGETARQLGFPEMSECTVPPEEKRFLRLLLLSEKH